MHFSGDNNCYREKIKQNNSIVEFLNGALKSVQWRTLWCKVWSETCIKGGYKKRWFRGNRILKREKAKQRECQRKFKVSRLLDLRDNKGASVLGELLVWWNLLDDVREEFWVSEGVGGSVEEYEQGSNMMSYRFWKSKIHHSTVSEMIVLEKERKQWGPRS